MLCLPVTAVGNQNASRTPHLEVHFDCCSGYPYRGHCRMSKKWWGKWTTGSSGRHGLMGRKWIWHASVLVIAKRNRLLSCNQRHRSPHQNQTHSETRGLITCVPIIYVIVKLQHVSNSGSCLTRRDGSERVDVSTCLASNETRSHVKSGGVTR